MSVPGTAALPVETARDELSFLPGPVVDVPVIALINGVAAGAGIYFAADADIAIASTEARFLDPHVSMGQVSGMGPLTRRSPRTYEHNLLANNFEPAWELVRRQRSHPDAAEGPRAFREKRAPAWARPAPRHRA